MLGTLKYKFNLFRGPQLSLTGPQRPHWCWPTHLGSLGNGQMVVAWSLFLELAKDGHASSRLYSNDFLGSSDVEDHL